MPPWTRLVVIRGGTPSEGLARERFMGGVTKAAGDSLINGSPGFQAIARISPMVRKRASTDNLAHQFGRPFHSDCPKRCHCLRWYRNIGTPFLRTSRLARRTRRSRSSPKQPSRVANFSAKARVAQYAGVTEPALLIVSDYHLLRCPLIWTDIREYSKRVTGGGAEATQWHGIFPTVLALFHGGSSAIQQGESDPAPAATPTTSRTASLTGVRSCRRPSPTAAPPEQACRLTPATPWPRRRSRPAVPA